MKIYYEIESLMEFEPWCGAVYNHKRITEKEIQDEIDDIIEEIIDEL